MRLQLLGDPFERMATHDHLRGPIGAKHQQPRTLPPPGEVREQIEGRVITPVQVLEYQYQRALGR